MNDFPWPPFLTWACSFSSVWKQPAKNNVFRLKCTWWMNPKVIGSLACQWFSWAAFLDLSLVFFFIGFWNSNTKNCNTAAWLATLLPLRWFLFIVLLWTGKTHVMLGIETRAQVVHAWTSCASCHVETFGSCFMPKKFSATCDCVLSQHVCSPKWDCQHPSKLSWKCHISSVLNFNRLAFWCWTCDWCQQLLVFCFLCVKSVSNTTVIYETHVWSISKQFWNQCAEIAYFQFKKSFHLRNHDDSKALCSRFSPVGALVMSSRRHQWRASGRQAKRKCNVLTVSVLFFSKSPTCEKQQKCFPSIWIFTWLFGAAAVTWKPKWKLQILCLLAHHWSSVSKSCHLEHKVFVACVENSQKQWF